jgi:pentapeptide MXKDX repeat protein
MTVRSRLIFSLSAVTMCFGVALAPAAFAQGMTKETPATTSDKMAKPDAMGKTDAMAKPAEKAGAMKKTDGMSEKKDGMSDPMKK